MKIVYLGSGEFGIECLNAILNSEHSLDFIVTQPPRPAGRGKASRPTPVAHWAKQNSIAFIEPVNVNAPEIVEEIASHLSDVIVVVAFGQMIGDEIINMPAKAVINVHASLVPKYRGAAPINWAIINGETETGISIIKVIKKMDAGDILAQAGTNIENNETAGQLHGRLAKIAPPLLIECLNKIADGSVVYTPQDESKASVISKLTKSDGYLDFSDSAEILHRKIRGLSPWPGASANYLSQQTGKNLRVIIASAEIIETENPGLQPGTLDENLNVVCGDGALKITKIKPAGKTLMDFIDFINGQRTKPGDTFAKIDD